MKNEKCIIKFMDGTKTKITEEDHKNLIGKTGLVFVSSIRQSVNISIIARIVPEDMADELEDKRNIKEGMLYDGTPVIKHFGSWYIDGDFDEKGSPRRRIDPTYYKEVARDCVISRKRFDTIKHLSRKERLKLILKGTDALRIGGMKQLKDITKSQIKTLSIK